MPWPTPSDYQDAVQNPGICFADPRLRAAQPALGPLGLPKVASGNYCSVYELHTSSRRWAVRCFNRQVPDMERRYHIIDQHLNRHPLPWLVGFDYLNEGIRIHGRWYPLVVMDWVEGPTLSRYLEKRVRDSTAVRGLAEQWPQVIADLRGAQIAHGDLQHGNLLVADEAIRLVDYDNLFLPVFRGERSPELGRTQYQHPARTADDFNENIGNFAALVIHLTLRALAADSSLWRFYDGENLVLTADDYRHPAASSALAKMRASPDPLVPRLVGELARCCALPPSQVPPLEMVLARVGAGPGPHQAAASSPPPRRSPGGVPDWIGPLPDPSPPRPAPRAPGSHPRAPAPPVSAPGERWWETPSAPEAEPAPSPKRRPTWMPSAASGPVLQRGGGTGTAALPRRPAASAPGVGGCLASLVRSCMVMVVMVWLAVAAGAWWLYQRWEQTGQVPAVLLPARPPAPPPSPPVSGPRPPAANPRSSVAPWRGSVSAPPLGPGSAGVPPASPERAGRPRSQAPWPSTPRSRELLRAAEIRLRAGDAEGALALLEQAQGAGLRLTEPESGRRFFAARAEALYRADQYSRSLEAFAQALHRDPANDRLRLLYGETLETVGRIAAAREQCARVAARGRTRELRHEARERQDRLAGRPRASA